MTTPTIKPSYPFYLGAGVGGAPAIPDETGGFSDRMPDTVTLDGYTFSVDLKQWSSGPVDTFRDTVVAGDQPNDILFNAKGAWARYKYSWHHGRGQSLGDLDENADPFRFEKSDRMFWTTKYQLTQHRSTSKTQAAASGTPLLCRSADFVFLADGANLWRTPDLITWTAMTAPGGTINAMTTDGTDMYITTTTVTGKYIGSGTTLTAFGTPPGAGDNIAFVSGRLLLAQANVLKEIGSTGATVTTIKTHFQPAFRWTTIFNIGSRIYIGGFAGTRSELHTVTTDSAGALVQSQEAAPLPMGEKLRLGLAYSGAAVLCTSAGLRFAEVSGDGTLTYGPLIDEPGDVQCACADGRFVFAGWSSMDGTRSGVVRLVVDDEVSPLQPAYSNDISESTTVAAVTGVARIGGKTCFAVTGSGAWTESSSSYESTATLYSSKLTFGTVEPKALVSFVADFAPLKAAQSVKAEVFDENGVLIADGVQATLDSTTLEFDLNGENVVSAQVKVTLLSDGSNTVTLYRWRLRSYPIPPPVFQWLLPLIVKDAVRVNMGEGQQASYNMEDVHIWVEELYASRRYAALRIGSRVYRVRCENFEWKPDNWDQDGDGPQGLLFVQLLAAS